MPAVDASKLDRWAGLIASGRIDTFGEQEILRDFLTDIFVGLLGYTPPGAHERHTIGYERHVEVDGKFADAVLGDFNGHHRFVVAIEGKGPRDPLDRPYAGRRMSAVDQGYRYAINLPCDWILVTSIRQTRLYHKGADQHTYERFDTEQLADDEAALKRFLFLLGADRVVPPTGQCHFAGLLAESDKVGRELTKSFYVSYANMRQDVYELLSRDNPQVPRHDVLSSTQKILDRVLFIAFSEDRGLVPAESILKAYEHSDPYHPRPIWQNFCGLFDSINRGNAALGIHAYNGGLFASDLLLDSLDVSDDVCGHLRDIGDFDYRPAHEASGESKVIDVDILGHIFEQSISDLEKLRNELDGHVEPQGLERHKTRRKREGAFYTPSFITRYIVEQALGGSLRDRFDSLRTAHQAASRGGTKAALGDPAVYELDKLTKPARAALVRFWEAWQDELTTIRILDPACGSGAFLIEAFDQLHATYQESNERLAELRGHRTLFDLDKRILENNLYGVDLNEEAIEICRLSLWIKTAERGKALTSLDHPIRVGNSVVADPAVHAKAFDWQAAFPEVFEQGGFDVVIGNPPYVRQEWLTPFKPHWEASFKTYDGVADIFTYFFEQGLSVLRDRGRLAYITSGSWVRGNYGSALRKHLIEATAIESIIDFGEFQPFEDAEMIRPSITILRKGNARGEMRLFKWLVAGRPPENLTEVIETAPTMRTDRLGADAWELDPDNVIDLRKKLAVGGRTLKAYTGGKILRGVLTGLTEVFVIDEERRARLVGEDPRSAEIIKPFVQGTHIRPWYTENVREHLLAIKSSANYRWPWSDSADNAEEVFRQTYPAIHAYLNEHRDRAIKRQDQGRYWWELRACAYWDAFDQPKVLWPDISKLPRFSLDRQGLYCGNTVYTIPLNDSYLLGVLSSWATWFYISKTAQPLRLRGDRWQYRLFTQFMEEVPIPDASEHDRQAIAGLAERAGSLGRERYDLQSNVQLRLRKAFGESSNGDSRGLLNEKARAWWEVSSSQLGAALKTSFKLPSNPLLNPRTADEWEPYLAEKHLEVDRITKELADAEAEINERVFRLFNLTPDEIKLLQREVEH